MPEAAEVTVASRQLDEVATGRTLERLAVTHSRTSRAQPVEDLARFEGQRVTGVSRHGKWIVVGFDELDERLGIHLRMSGQLLVADPGDPHPDRHVHAVLHLSEIASSRQEGSDAMTRDTVSGGPAGPAAARGRAVEVWFRDPRTFGELRVLPDGAPVAPDLFDPAVTGESLAAAAARRRVGVKAVLLDQLRSVSGIGSYLADEALHRAGVSPLAPADRLTVDHWTRILAAARAITDESAAAGGVTLPDEGWIDLRGRPGRYAEQLRVHGREHCATCGAPTARATVGGRSARWCPTCQPS